MFNGLGYSVFDNEIKAGYIINPKLNMVIEGRLQFRKYNAKILSTQGFKTNSFMVTFATNIFNRYYDLPILF